MEHLILKISGAAILILLGLISVIRPMALRSSIAVHILTAEQYKKQARITGLAFIAIAIFALFNLR
ncbi:MAG TPA: hypothetical protein VK808_02295 [Bacteroidia bacterium]|nr:hypothetical protein [Bacteroidia bacterium]